MFFGVLKSIFWIVVIVVLFPVNETENYKQFTNNTQGHLTPEHLYALTKETVDDVDTFCKRNQATCKNFKGMITEFGGKVKYIGDSIFDWAKEIGNTENTQMGEIEPLSDDVKMPEKSQYYEFENTIKHRETSNLYPTTDKLRDKSFQNMLAFNDGGSNKNQSDDDDLTTASTQKRIETKPVVKEGILVNHRVNKNKKTIIIRDTLTKDDKKFPWQSVSRIAG